MKKQKECKNCIYWYQDEVISFDPPDFWLQDFCWKHLPMDAKKCEFYAEDNQ